MRRNFYSLFVVAGFLSFLLTGCVSTGGNVPTTTFPPSGKGVYHKVRKGETLWRISQTYHTDLEQIVEVNHIPSGARLEEGQLVFIPGADRVLSISIPTTVDDTNKEEFVWPLQGSVRHYFGERRGGAVNKGVTIEGREGDRVKASRQGKVVFADYLPGYDYMVVIDHRDGYSTVYAHNAKLLVNLGSHVNKGDAIAEVGHVGRLAALYFEVRQNGQAHDPLHYLPK